MRVIRHIFSFVSLIIYLPVVGCTCITVWLDRKLKFRLSFPRDVDELVKKQEWCIAELKKSGAIPASAIIQSYTVSPLNSDVILRSNAGKIEVKYSVNGAEKTLQCFAKFAPVMGSVWNRAIFNLQLNHIKESFFNLHFIKEDKEIPSPVLYYSDVSILTGNLCLITEYMSDDVHYLECAFDHFPNEHLQLALQGLAALHARYWGKTGANMKKVMPIEDSTVYLLELIVAFSWSNTTRKILLQSWRYMNRQQTVIHGDSRVGNMMFPKGENGRFVLIDWQAVRKGMAVYDLAYFLVLSLITEHRLEVEEQAINTYYNHLVAKGVTGYSLKELKEDYNHACLCVLVLLSLPLLSGEVSAEGEAAKMFVFGMGVWRDRLAAKFKEFDYSWLAANYYMTEQEGRKAVNEMLGVITSRLEKI